MMNLHRCPRPLRQARGLRHPRLLPEVLGLRRQVPRSRPRQGQGLVAGRREEQAHLRAMPPRHGRVRGLRGLHEGLPHTEVRHALRHEALRGHRRGARQGLPRSWRATPLHDKGYFGPGQLPHFERSFFDFPHGRREDWLFEQFKERLANDDTPDGGELTEFAPEGQVRHKEEPALPATNRSVPQYPPGPGASRNDFQGSSRRRASRRRPAGATRNFGRYALEHPGDLRIIAVAEPNDALRTRFARAHGIPTELTFRLLGRPG